MSEREIKFRGMDISGIWHYGYLSVVTNKRAGVTPGSYISNSVGAPFAYEVRPETVGQFTGLKDKNGKEIFEGDVVRFNDNYMTENPTQQGTVGFGNASFYNDSGYTKHYRWIDYECKVIGNIYENPELLDERSWRYESVANKRSELLQ